MTQELAAEIFRRAAESVEVLSPPLDGVVAQAGARRGRRRRRTVGGLVAGAVVAGAVTWVAVRDSGPDEELGPTVVKRSPNPADIAWYADGRLHLDHVTVELPALAALSELNGGALYADEEGMVAFVAADGDRRLLGHQEPGTAVVTSAAVGWAAWIDSGDDGREVVVYDVSTDEVLAKRAAGADARLVAIDQGRVYYEESGSAFVWTPGVASPERLPRAGLVDVESATRLYQDGRRLDMVQSFFSVDFVRLGVGGRLSAGGSYVLTRNPVGDAGPDEPFRPLLYDATSGDRLRSGVHTGERAVDAAFGDNRTVTYLVASAAELAGDGDPLLTLRTCAVGGLCDDVAPVSTGGERPLLAH